MKEPGQIAYEAWWAAFDETTEWFVNPDDWRHWNRNDATGKARWAAVEAACRAEGMREAARIAGPKEPDTGTTDYEKQAYDLRWNIEQAILSAIRAMGEKP